MPEAIKRYYTRAEIQEILSVSKGKAHEIMKTFEIRGQLLWEGNIRRVRIEVFEAWLKEMERKDRHERTSARRKHPQPV